MMMLLLVVVVVAFKGISLTKMYNKLNAKVRMPPNTCYRKKPICKIKKGNSNKELHESTLLGDVQLFELF